MFNPYGGIFGQPALSRRAALSTMGMGLGSIAMQSILGKSKPFLGKVASVTLRSPWTPISTA